MIRILTTPRDKPPNLDDRQLLEAVQNRDPVAFDALVERYGHRLLAFGMRMCGHREDAEDVYQETLIKAFEALADLRDPGAVRTWLFRVAANQCRMNRRKVPPGRDLSLTDQGDVDGGDVPAVLADVSSLPVNEALRSELRAALDEALAELPVEHRLVVVLRDLEDLNTQETADALGISKSAVKMRLHRGRHVLRRYLARFDASLAPLK